MASTTATGSNNRSRNLNAVLFYVFLFLFVFVSVFPLLWIFKMSIITSTELFRVPPTIIPQDPTVSSYTKIFGDTAFIKGLRNSVIIAGTATVLCLTLGALAAYAIARLRFSFKNTTMTIVLAIAFFPQVAILAPLFIQFSAVGLINTYWAAILTDTVFALPLTIWLLVAFFKELPKDLEEAARVDGATTLQAFWKVIVPLAAPGVFTTAILTFIFAWNDYIFANTFLFDESTQPVTVVIPDFAAAQYTTDYGAQAGAAVVVTVPLVIMVLIFQRRIVSGLTSGAVKG